MSCPTGFACFGCPFCETQREQLADTAAIAAMCGVRPVTVRWWAHKGYLTRRGTDEQHRALYSVDDAERLAERVGVAKEPQLT